MLLRLLSVYNATCLIGRFAPLVKLQSLINQPSSLSFLPVSKRFEMTMLRAEASDRFHSAIMTLQVTRSRYKVECYCLLDFTWKSSLPNSTDTNTEGIMVESF